MESNPGRRCVRLTRQVNGLRSRLVVMESERERQRERERENKPILRPLQRNIKGQSWLTQFGATTVGARLKMKEKKITMS